ncbi:sulfatase [Microbacterium sp. MYb62]|uniref:sulfatase family protein n=1 Tax=Microbacterium sp. MYb62 TaxID=1848690 RepID=UPI000CFC74FE|nr:sulfatase-like hydrolase/transferase [Microbacterium sp. MYb62]PRB14797.1 sulfatase [Microbacterium sp. MYb62]
MTRELPVSGRRPNILLVMADQLAAHVLDRDPGGVRTPHLDRLRASGADFARAYVSFPLCVPSRASLLTGRMPHEVGVDGNRPADAVEPGTRSDSLGHLLSAAGYDCAYAGKWHATTPEPPEDAGFRVIHPFGDEGLVDACSSWMAEREVADAPFLLVASFDDPHTICEYARNQPLPYGNVELGDVRDAPALPLNFAPGPYESQAVRDERSRAALSYGTLDYGPDDWRQYRAAYRRLIERFDAHLGDLLAGLEASGHADATIVIVTSDHGDGDGAHGWNQKTALFEECVRVPLLVSGPGVAPGVRSVPVSASIDILPTLLQLSSTPRPPGLTGVPLRIAEAADSADAHDRRVVVETLFDHVSPPRTRGRALYHGRHKYVVYSGGRHREQLFDIEADPGEMRNLVVESAYDAVLEDLRGHLYEWCSASDDRDFLKYLVLPAHAAHEAHREIFAKPY